MLEWLKDILGDGYTEEIDKKVSAEIGKGFVTKADFDAEKTRLTAAHAQELTRLRIDTAVDQALTSAGAKNNVAVRALMAEFLKDAKLSEDGTVSGLSEAVKKLSEDAGTAFLFEGKSDKPLPGAVPAFPGRSGKENVQADEQAGMPVII